MTEQKLSKCPFCGVTMIIEKLDCGMFMPMCGSSAGNCIAGEDGTTARSLDEAIEMANHRVTK